MPDLTEKLEDGDILVVAGRDTAIANLETID